MVIRGVGLSIEEWVKRFTTSHDETGLCSAMREIMFALFGFSY